MRYFWIIILIAITFQSSAQKMRVEDFIRYNKSALKKNALKTDKHQALLDLYTNEKGFQFIIDDESIPVAENDGFITLSIPQNTGFLTIRHSDYGQTIWKIPEKKLKKKTRYRAYLHTESPRKEFQQEKQWVIFTIHPEHAIIYVDSLMQTTQNGHLSLYLPIGNHSYRIESPFYKAISDTIVLTDSTRLEMQFTLEPFYSYLTVVTNLPEAIISLDGQPIGQGHIETGRIMPGKYRLSISTGEAICYDKTIEIGNAERKVIDLRNITLKPSSTNRMMQQEKVYTSHEISTEEADKQSHEYHLSEESYGYAEETASSKRMSNVHITAFDEETEIWLNRRKISTGEWQGVLEPGFYAVSSMKDGLESRTDFFWVEEGKAVELNLSSPLADYGFLNLSCDEQDATVLINGIVIGTAPCVLKNLPTDKSYRIKVVKGKKSAERTILLKGNDIANIKLHLR